MPDLGHIQPGQRCDDREARVNGALGFAFVRERVAEESYDAVAQSLEYVAFIARDAYRAGILVAADDPLQHFRIHAVRQLGEAHHVPEEDGELTPLACFTVAGVIGDPLHGDGGLSALPFSNRSRFGKSIEELLAMP